MDWLARVNTTGGGLYLRRKLLEFVLRPSAFPSASHGLKLWTREKRIILAHIVLRQNELLFAATKTAAQRGKLRILPHPVMCASPSVKH